MLYNLYLAMSDIFFHEVITLVTVCETYLFISKYQFQ